MAYKKRCTSSWCRSQRRGWCATDGVVDGRPCSYRENSTRLSDKPKKPRIAAKIKDG